MYFATGITTDMRKKITSAGARHRVMALKKKLKAARKKVKTLKKKVTSLKKKASK